VKFLRQCIANNDAGALRTYLGAVKPQQKQTEKLPIHIEVNLTHCRSCLAGHLRYAVVAGQGNQITRTELPSTALTPELVQALQPL
jgi:hypothetical protein